MARLERPRRGAEATEVSGESESLRHSVVLGWEVCGANGRG